MPKFITNSNTTVAIDSTAGAVKQIESLVTEIDGVGKAFDMLDITAFSDSEVKQLMGFVTAQEVTITCLYSSGSSEADAYFRGSLGTTNARTLTIKPDGTRSVSGEYFIRAHDYIMSNKALITTRTILTPDGKVTLS